MNHNLIKLGLYFNQKSYWSLTNSKGNYVQTELGSFFLNLKDRLNDNHYLHFDEEGFPMDMVNGKLKYTYTTICSYALAKWQLYLETGEKKYSTQLFNTINFLFQNNKITPYGGVVFLYGKILSAMNQGEALSILARGYEQLKDKAYIDFARKIILPYDVSIKEEGVKGQFKNEQNLFWYEEYAETPSKHVLNGMIYSLVGLWEIYQVMPELIIAKELFDKGVGYVESALPLFDTEKWSWYWIDDENPNYIASAMYHNLHICQLEYLYQITNNNIFNQYAKKFSKYSENPFYKLLAGFSLVKGKLVKK